MKRSAIFLTFALAIMSTTSCALQPIENSFSIASPIPAATGDSTSALEGQPIPTGIVPEALVYPFVTSYFDQITEIYKGMPDLWSAAGEPPSKITISGSYDGLQVVIIPLAVEPATASVREVLVEAGFVKVEGISSKLDFQTEAKEGDEVYYRGFDNTFVSIAGEGDSLLLNYAHNDYDGPAVESGNGDGYKGIIFDSMYDVTVNIYKEGVPSPDEPLNTPPEKIVIEGDHSQIAYYYPIDNPEVREKSFELTMEAASFNKDGAIYKKGPIEVSIDVVPEQPPSGFAEAIVTMRFVT